jgi:uncharacterized protein (TIGR02679 family)
MRRQAVSMPPDWLADPALRPLWQVAAARLERRALEPGGAVVLDGLDRAARHALGALLGRPVVSAKVRVDLAQLDSLLRARSGVGGLCAVAEAALGRRLRDLAAERDAASRARAEPFVAARAWLDTHPGVAPTAWPDEFLAAVRRSGLLTRTPDASRVLVQACEVLAALTGSTETISRTELAVRYTGDAHGLDDGRPPAQVVLRGLAVAAGVDPPSAAAARRALWERYGVAVDAVSATCLVLGLRPPAEGPAARRLRMAADDGDPVHLTRWDLRRGSLAVAAGTGVLVCENPRVLEAFAERHGGRFAVVCVAGEPNIVTVDLLRALAGGGAVLRYHGDFDWPGIAIANRLRSTVGAEPWLMTAADYLRAVGPFGPLLLGRRVEPSWESELGREMDRQETAVHEEAVIEQLLRESPPCGR